MWNFILTFTDLYLHAHECGTMEVSYSIQNLNHGPEQCWPGRYHCPFPVIFRHSHPSQVPCCFVCDPIDYVTSLPVWPLCWEWLVSNPSVSNQPWGLQVIPDAIPNPWWEAVLAGQNDPVRCADHCVRLGPSAINTSEGLTNLSLPEYPVKGKVHGLIQPAKAWVPRSTQPCVFAPLLRDQRTRPSFLSRGSVRGAAVNVPSPTRLRTGHSSNIKFDEPAHSSLHAPRKAVHPGVHSAPFSQGIGLPRNKCQQHAYSRPHHHGQDVSKRLSGTPTNSPLPTSWPCGCVQLYTCGWHLFLSAPTS